MRLYVEIISRFSGPSWSPAERIDQKIGRVRKTPPSADDGSFWVEVRVPKFGTKLEAD